jgi:hypothetical protein
VKIPHIGEEKVNDFTYLFFLLEIELRALHLLGKGSTTQAIPQSFCFFSSFSQ